MEVSLREVCTGDVVKQIEIEKDVICPSCNGTREKGGQSHQCYSCKGSGLRKDPLFHKVVMCNTCTGHGTLVKEECDTCFSRGVIRKKVVEDIEVPKNIEDGHVLEFNNRGHET